MRALDNCRHLGRIARECGLSRSANPYLKGFTPRCKEAWYEGWDASDARIARSVKLAVQMIDDGVPVVVAAAIAENAMSVMEERDAQEAGEARGSAEPRAGGPGSRPAAPGGGAR